MTECICSTRADGDLIPNPKCPAHGTGWTHIGGSAYMAPIGTPLPERFPPPPVRIRRQCGACDGTGKIPTPENTLRECPLCNGTGTQL